jgi:ribose transport system substrate-binding protein
MRIASSALIVAAALAGFTAPALAAKPLKAIGVTVGDLANPFFVAIGRGTEDAAKKIAGNGVKEVRSEHPGRADRELHRQ